MTTHSSKKSEQSVSPEVVNDQKIDHHAHIRHSFNKVINFFIVIIIVFVMVAFAFKSYQSQLEAERVQFKRIPLKQTQQTVPFGLNESSSSGSSISSTSATFNLQGPLICSYKDNKENLDLKAYIKNKQIYVETPHQGEQERILIAGDCLYNWDEGEATGTKMCGVSQYMSLFESLAKLGLVDPTTLLRALSEMRPSGFQEAPSEMKTIQNLNQICIKGEIKDSIFEIPINVQFKEEMMVKPS